MTRRSRIDIQIDILKAVGEGRKKPTRIMYRANLTWSRLKKYLSFLVRNDLIIEEENGQSTLYTLTTQGKTVLEYSRRIKHTSFIREKKEHRQIIHSYNKLAE